MVSITLSVSEEIREIMRKHQEINWSGFVKNCILGKAEQLEWKEKMLEELQQQQPIVDWSVQLQKKSRN